MTKQIDEATLFWRGQLTKKPVRCRFGLHGIPKFHRRLKLMPATIAFKGSQVVTQWTRRYAAQRHF